MSFNHPHIGHIHLTVSNLDTSLVFYRDLLGFQVTSRIGDSAVFLSAGGLDPSKRSEEGYHHHIGLNTWANSGSSIATPAPSGHTGMYHVAFLYPDRKSLANVVKRIIDAGYPIEGTADHGVSEAVYLRDPDNNGVEIYVDRPRETWTVSNDGMVEMVTERLDVADLLAQAD